MSTDNVFPIRQSPSKAGDDTLETYFDIAQQITTEHAKALLADPGLATKLDNQPWSGGPILLYTVPELLFSNVTQRAENARAFDLRSEYTSFAPEGERWTCIDENTYDGAPDSRAPATFIGRGASEKEARMDLLAQFYEYDNPELPATAAERALDEAIDEGLANGE